jgi:two-component system LytT family response regulator
MTGAIRTLIVDDEPLAREGLRLMLRGVAAVDVVGEAGDGAAAVDAIGALRPDVVLLDVQMPGLSGFDVIDRARTDYLPRVVFVTAYDAHALRAFQVHAFDYLLKPVQAGRLAEAMARVRADLSRGAPARARVLDVIGGLGAPGAPRPPAYKTRFAVRDRDRFVLVQAADVDWLDAAANYVRLNARGREYLVRATLAEMERQLDPHAFTRIHRSTIVNVSRIRDVRVDAHGDYDVHLHDGRSLKMSRNYRDRLLGT